MENSSTYLFDSSFSNCLVNNRIGRRCWWGADKNCLQTLGQILSSRWCVPPS